MDMSGFDVIIGMDWLTAHRSSLTMIVEGLLPTHRMVVVLCSRGISMMLYPRQCTTPGGMDS